MNTKRIKRVVVLLLVLCFALIPSLKMRATGIQSGENITLPFAGPLAKEEEEEEPEEEVEDPVMSADIAELDGTVYTLKGYESTKFNMKAIPFKNAKYDYVSSFAFYGSKAYYCCKEAGTSGFHTALYETTLDGKKQTQLYAPSEEEQVGLDRFVIKENCMYFKTYNRGYVWNKYDLKARTLEQVSDVPEDVRDMVDNMARYYNGKRFFVENQKLKVQNTDGTEKVIAQADVQYVYLEAVLSDGKNEEPCVYYSRNEDDCKVALYRTHLSTNKTELIGRKQEVGGGGYFNW